MSSNPQVAVELFTSVLSGKKPSMVPFAEQFKVELEPDENFCITYSTKEGGGIENLTLFYRSPGNTNEVIPVYFGNFTAKQFQQGAHLEEIRDAAHKLGI